MMQKLARLTIVVVLVFCAFPQESKAEEFTGKSFLTWERKDQDFYFEVSIGMAAIIASQNDKEQSECISSWYYPHKEERNDSILAIILDNPEYHPYGILIGILQKHCKSFKYRP